MKEEKKSAFPRALLKPRLCELSRVKSARKQRLQIRVSRLGAQPDVKHVVTEEQEWRLRDGIEPERGLNSVRVK